MGRRMLTAIVITAVISLGAGATGGAFLTRRALEAKVEAAEARQAFAEEQADARIAEATRDTVDAAGKNTTGAIGAALAPENKDADTRADFVNSSAVQRSVGAALEPSADPVAVTLAGYSLCLAAAQGKGEGSAAFGCQDRGKRFDEAVAARIASLDLAGRSKALDDRAASLDAIEMGFVDRKAALDAQERELERLGCSVD